MNFWESLLRARNREQLRIPGDVLHTWAQFVNDSIVKIQDLMYAEGDSYKCEWPLRRIAFKGELKMPGCCPSLRGADHDAKLGQVLRAADLKRELSLVYQPIFDIYDERVMGVEALCRWSSAWMGPVSPAAFIPLAERLGLMHELTCVLLQQALSDAQEWADTIRLSFNLSAHDLNTAANVARIISLIEASDLDAGIIDFELTETAILCAPDEARDAISLLQASGARIVMDDFGAGHSSLSRLRELPFDKAKLDRGFIQQRDRAGSREILSAMVSLFRALDMPLIVEGVETTEELCIVRDLGVRLVQGFYLAKPMKQNDLLAWTRQCKGGGAKHGSNRLRLGVNVGNGNESSGGRSSMPKSSRANKGARAKA